MQCADSGVCRGASMGGLEGAVLIERMAVALTHACAVDDALHFTKGYTMSMINVGGKVRHYKILPVAGSRWCLQGKCFAPTNLYPTSVLL